MNATPTRGARTDPSESLHDGYPCALPAHVDVSVIIPTWRRPALLAQCLRAVVTQDFEPARYEIIVCDDGPDDATRETVARFADDAAPRGLAVRYVPVTRTQGPAGARNAGWSTARAPLIAFTDDDTVPDPRWLTAGTRALADGVDALRTQLETNTIGPLLVTRAFAPALAANGGGTIVNVLSVLSWVTMAPTSTYSAAKAAAWSITNATRGELKAQGTRVVGVHVGYLDTDMAAHVDGPKTDPVVLARQILDAVENGDEEVLGDELSRGVKGALSGPASALSA